MCNHLVHGTKLALAAALAFGAGGSFAQAADEPESPVIQIGKAEPGTPVPGTETDGAIVGTPHQAELPKYWIGLAGGAIPPDHVLRAHVDLPEGQGLLVATVVPESPAEKAGVKQHDILLRANGAELHEMHDLIDLVLNEGEKKGQIALEILRKGAHETLNLTPEERPADAGPVQLGRQGPIGEGFGAVGPEGIPQELLQQFRGRVPFEFRNFGPDVAVGGGHGGAVGNIPSGVSVNIAKEEGKPTHVTVTRGDETWEVVEGDAESLKQLPEDLQPFVAQMLQGESPMDLHMRGLGQERMPQLQQRMEQMEKQMQQMLERMEKNNPPADEAEQSK